MKVYVSGPMTGLPEFNFPAFTEAARELRNAGYEVVSPHEQDEEGEEKPWEDYLREDLRLLLDCVAVATLDGCEASRGSQLECYVARALGMPVRPVSEFLEVTV